MRPKIRLLLVGVLLCIGLQVRTIGQVQAAQTLPTGNFQGNFKLDAHIYTQKHVSSENATATSDEFIYWTVIDPLTLHVYGPNTGLLMPRGSGISVNVKQFSANHFTAGGKDCIWSDSIFGLGNFVSIPPLSIDGVSSGNYNPAERGFTVGLTWTKVKLWYNVDGRSHGSAPNCSSYWGDGLAKIQQKAIDNVTDNIATITFTITSIGTDSVTGTCDLPKWKGKYSITDGTSDHIVDSCTWRVYLVRSKGPKTK